MSRTVFKACLILVALLLTITFCVLMIPALIENFDIIAAFGAGSVNPFAAGYSTELLFYWIVLAVWVWFEASNDGIRHG
jgi:hypothetical protein